MAREQAKPIAKTRTQGLRREIGQTGFDWRRFARSRTLGLAVLIWAGFVVCMGGVAVWTHEQQLLAVGRVMRQTRTVRAPFEVVDDAATQQLRSAAPQRAPRVYVGDGALLTEIRTSLENLPIALKDAQTVEDVEPTLAKQFGLTSAEALAAVKQQAGTDGQSDDRWVQRVTRLDDLLHRTPILDPQTFQVEVTSQNKVSELRVDKRPTERAPSSYALNAESPKLAEELRMLAADAGFSGPLLGVVTARLTGLPRPTFVFDNAATTALQDAEAAQIPAQIVKYPDREVIYRRGDVLQPEQLRFAQAAAAAEERTATSVQTWTPRLAVLGIVLAIGLAMSGYIVLFCPEIRRNPMRMFAVAALMAGTGALACVATAAQPGLAALTAVLPTVFVSVILCIAYNQRTALAFGAMHAILVCVALDLPIGACGVMIAGVGASVWLLREVRDRHSLVRMGVAEGIVLGVGTFVMNLVELPITPEAIMQTARDAGLAAFGGLLLAGVTLFILPTLERMFDLTTGMTLVELRDPKQPLLRQLQLRAPGTYNHSLNLASLAEAAAESIGANGLLAYVGALYHDIGKMNKPDYFVENQTPGFNRHDKLSPAMSLLVILGHVKDGMELAEEFNLPRPLRHFIESHHGTTLVEYFFHRACRQAEGTASTSRGPGNGHAPKGDGDADLPDELEYRYPGPKPRTKEAAIVMICDSVESTSRTMADPTPGRIDALVRTIATKRLMDGQLDECDITLRELNTVVEAVSRALASIYHGRIAYPAGASSGGGSAMPASEAPTSTGLAPATGPIVPEPALAGAGARARRGGRAELGDATLAQSPYTIHLYSRPSRPPPFPAPLHHARERSMSQTPAPPPAPATTSTTKSMDEIMALCKRRGFIYQASEIYGGINGFWDYGPLGTMLKRNLREAWWQDMIMNPCWGRKGPDGDRVKCVPLETRIVQHPKVWEASGHIGGFNDPMVDCRETKSRYRYDHVSVFVPESGDAGEKPLFAYVSDTPSEAKQRKKAEKAFGAIRSVSLTTIPVANFAKVLGPDAEKVGTLTEPRQFNLMFRTYLGATATEDDIAYLRPETAQGIFVQFKNVVDTTRVRIPFGIGNTGTSFRNEVTPRNFTFRSREFEQMELEFFCHPDESAAWYTFWRDFRMEWWKSIGLAGDNLILREHEKDELSHYSTGTSDVEYRFPFTAPGFGELEGIAHRGNYDLTQHAKHSGVKLEYFDTDRGELLPNGAKKGERYMPHCIEPAAGLDRGVLALICEAYTKDPSRPSPEIMKFHPRVAPIKAAVFPLVNKDGMPEIAEKLYNELFKRFGKLGLIETDAKQNIGKRYARMDEAGCPFCFTIDGDTVKDQTVTVRDRDSGTQQRIGLDKVLSYVSEKLDQ